MCEVIVHEPPTAIFVVDVNMREYRLCSISTDGNVVTVKDGAGFKNILTNKIVSWKFRSMTPVTIIPKGEENE